MSAIRKAVNLPAWKTIAIDMEHVLSGHELGRSRLAQSMAAGGSKTVFGAGMTESQVEKAIGHAYRYGKKIRTQGERVVVEGEYNGMKIETWVNTAKRKIETAYPVE